jgi:DNA-binding SARP family transcriptional activator
VEFRVLGPLEVVENGRRVPISGVKQRSLLAMLCLHANEAVLSDRLIDALWRERPPQRAQGALQYHVSQLRKLLGPERIETSPPGYRLRLSVDELDVSRFERLIAEDGPDREGRLREALALWRGPALADFEYTEFAQGEIARLEELRLGALEERIDADLARGRHAEVVGELEGLVRAHPLRERLRAQLMLALYRSGRQAEALAVYKETRERLVEELGIDPGEELQQLERRILNQDPELLPPPVDEEPELAASPVPREERKVVTALVCELRVATVADPEDQRALLAPVHVRLRAELERHGGTVEQIVGNAVVAVFGAPVAHEDDPERAVRAALAVRDWIAEQGDEMRLRAGIATGEALVSIGGDGSAVGAVVASAAELQQDASPGTIVVAEATHRLTRHAIKYEELRPGGWLAKQASGARPGFATAAAPFVGREAELVLLKQAYGRAAREPSVQLVTVVGEPGIGKTRLLAEFRELLDAALWCPGRCLSYGEGITFWALGEIVKAQAGILDSDPTEAAAAKLESTVSAVVGESERRWVADRLLALVGAGSAEATERTESFAAWRTFFEAIAAERPLVLVFEDLHWADAALLEFVDHLVDRSAGVPLLVVCTARPELFDREPSWGGGKRNSATISLSPLTHEDTARLLVGLGVADGQTPLIERAGGNPLYAEELVRMLGEPVPETLRALIAARLDTLEPGRKALLHDAAVVGKVFWAGALASMARLPQEPVLEGMHELGRKEFVRRARASSIANDVEYAFWHELVRDVAYAQIPRAERARKHVAAAEWIERRSERPADIAELLAHHYATARELAGEGAGPEIVDRAVQFLVLAAERAIRLDLTQGHRYYRQALALLPEDDPRRPKILADAADAGTKAGRDFGEVKADLEEAIAALRAQGETVAAANALRQLSFARFGRPESLEHADEARRLLEPLPPGPELALVYERFSHEHSMAGRPSESMEWSKKALPLLERFGLGDEVLKVRSRLAIHRCHLGDLSGMDELRQVAREARDPEAGYETFAVVVTLNNLAVGESDFGTGFRAGAEALRAAVDLGSRRGLERPAGWHKANLCGLLYELGEWDEVLLIHREVARLERVGVLAHDVAARILAARGKSDAAAAVVDELLRGVHELEGPSLRLAAFAAAATVATAQGESAAAVARVREFEETETDDASLLARYLAEIGRVCAWTGELETLKRLLDRASGLDPRLDRFVLGAHAVGAEARGEHARAETLHERAEQGWKDHDGVVERAHELVGLGRCRVVLGRASEAEAPLREARATFRRLGARTLVLEADKLLATKIG